MINILPPSRWISRLGALLLVGVGGVSSGAPVGWQSPGATDLDAEQRPDPIVTRQMAFSVPFTVNSQSGAPTEVHLFISTDNGESWQFYQRQAPQSLRFDFRADRDGDYWFAVRTVTVGADTPRSLRPELRVVVDTLLPEVELEAFYDEDGQVHARWSARDLHLGANAVQLDYQFPGTEWTQVAVPASPPGTVAAGEVGWWVGNDHKAIEVRATVADRAGNSRQIVKHLPLPLRLPVPPRSTDPLLNRLPLPPNTPAPLPVSPQRLPAIPSPAARLPTGRPLAASSAVLPPATSQPSEPAARQGGEERWEPTYAPAPTVTVPGNDGWTSAVQPYETPPRAPQPAASTPQPLHPPLTAEFESQNQPALHDSPSTDANLLPATPPDPSLRASRSHRFELAYDLRHLNEGTVDRVDLWWTQDDGATWQLYGHDPDLTSPLEVTATQEGWLGFRLVVATRDGRTGRPPRAGDNPDVVVLVDWTRPIAELVSAEYARGEQSGHLIVRWRASDAHLAETPVSLSFAAHPSGPWSQIAALANTGYYLWRPEVGVPEDVYLRLDVQDRAGNRTTHQLEHPVRTSPLRPQARILEVRPVGEPPLP